MAGTVEMADECLMRLESEDYESLVRVDNGQRLIDLFPDGILVSFKGDEIVDVQDGSGLSRGYRLPTIEPEDRNPAWSGETK